MRQLTRSVRGKTGALSTLTLGRPLPPPRPRWRATPCLARENLYVICNYIYYGAWTYVPECTVMVRRVVDRNSICSHWHRHNRHRTFQLSDHMCVLGYSVGARTCSTNVRSQDAHFSSHSVVRTSLFVGSIGYCCRRRGEHLSRRLFCVQCSETSHR